MTTTRPPTAAPEPGRDAAAPVRLFSRTEGFSSGPGQESISIRVRRVWQFRTLIGVLIRRDLKVKYAGSALGWVWSVLEPLMMSFVYWYVFTQIFKRSVGYDPYILFLVTGQMAWFWFLGAFNGGMKALRSESAMVRSTNVPRELWIVRVVASTFVQYLFTLPVVVIFAVAYRKPPSIYLLMVPLGWVMLAGLALGLGLILSPLTLLVKDIAQFMPIVIRVLFYATPILYAPENVPSALRPLVEFNPIAGVLTMNRAVFFPQEFRWFYILDATVSTAVILVIGLFVFRRLERQVLKEV